jgi:hypothetical protein
MPLLNEHKIVSDSGPKLFLQIEICHELIELDGEIVSFNLIIKTV